MAVHVFLFSLFNFYALFTFDVIDGKCLSNVKVLFVNI